ncbi:hypothetical protein [Burkholderia territorii]|nr:hypothetical protein [Burkholderia territorii]
MLASVKSPKRGISTFHSSEYINSIHQIQAGANHWTNRRMLRPGELCDALFNILAICAIVINKDRNGLLKFLDPIQCRHLFYGIDSINNLNPLLFTFQTYLIKLAPGFFDTNYFDR